jgi:E3 ubiquitin-protein ligase HUWE1
VVNDLVDDGFDEDLAREAVFRSNGVSAVAKEYCKAHKRGIAGTRNPIPADDAYNSTPPPEASTSNDSASSADPAAAPSEAMIVDPPTEPAQHEVERLFVDAAPGDAADTSSQGSDDNETDDTPLPAPSEASRLASVSAPQIDDSEAKPKGQAVVVTKDGLDTERAALRENLIDRCLDVIRAHPHSAIEISDLINVMVLRPLNDAAACEEVGLTLANALSSLAFDDDDKKLNGKSIAAYAHLLALLLQDKGFFHSTVEVLREKVEEYIGFLKIPPTSSNEELPPWIPYILLIVEILLGHDEHPPEVHWKPPTSENDEILPAVLQKRDLLISEDHRKELLDMILDILPRIGKEETLATSVLRVLVILTRNRHIAQRIGDRKNLQRLFVMAKQLASAGADSLKDNRTIACIMTILRHVIEDDETIKQIMQAEIRNLFESTQRSHRPLDISTYIRSLAAVALRAPEIFVNVTNDMVKLTRWNPPGSDGPARAHPLVLKDAAPELARLQLPPTESLDLGGRAADTHPSADIKQSTETGDKEMADAPKASQESKRPIVENPDGVIHFLLCELINYREVDDKETTFFSKETKPLDEAAADLMSQSNSSDDQPTLDDKDKKLQKPPFKADEHPIFVYRCFLLNCLAELLRSYNRTKVEFINFKRSAPTQTNTPVKPRSSVLNYLLNDLLCHGNLGSGTETVTSKKRAATSHQAQHVLVALVAKTSEKVINRSRDRFEYDDEGDLVFVRKFVLDTILKSYERASMPDEPLELRYSKMQCLAELIHQMVGEKDKDQLGSGRNPDSQQSRSQAQLRRMMYEKGYLEKLTASIAEIDLSYPGVKRTIKYILRVLKVLTDTAKELSHSNIIPSASLPESVDDEITSASSLSDAEDDREETPDLYRNSALGMLEPRDEDDESEDEDGMFCFMRFTY